MKKRWFAAVLVLAASCSTAYADPSALRRFFDEEWEWDLREHPGDATLYGDRRYDDKLTDLSPRAIEQRKAHLVERLRRARAFDASSLSETDRLSLEVFLFAAERDAELARFPTERMALTEHDGPHRDLPTLAQVPGFRETKHLRDYVARLRAIPRYIDQTIALLEAGRKSGWIVPREPIRNIVLHIRGVIGTETSVFYEPFKNLPANLASEGHTLGEQAKGIIKDAVNPAFERLARYVEKTYLPAARKDVGAWALPDGAAYYAASMRMHTTLDRSADEVHALGLAEVKRISTAMDEAMRKTGYTGTRADFAEMLRTDPRFYYKSGAQLLTGYRDIAKRIDGALPRLFGTLPRLPYGVIETPALEGPTATTAYYRPGSLEDARAGNFVANTYKPETRPIWEMESLTLHEAVPGHHLQIALAQELSDLPKFRREGMFTAFVEGWGLYAESLGPELGMFTNPYAKYGQLTYEMWRAVRLVVDTGMHAKHWTRQQAIDFFVANTAKSRHDIEVEIDRYIVWPGQALAYKTGQLEIRRLRGEAEKALGDRFDVRRFHDAVLGAGALPLPILARRIAAFIATERARKN